MAQQDYVVAEQRGRHLEINTGSHANRDMDGIWSTLAEAQSMACSKMMPTIARHQCRTTTDVIVTVLLRVKSINAIKPVRVAHPSRSRFHSNHGAAIQFRLHARFPRALASHRVVSR